MTNVTFKHLGALYTKQANSVHGLCNLLSRWGKNMGGEGHSRPINETMLVCRVIGNMHTVASVYWCVVGGEYELGMYADGGSYSCVCCECTLMFGMKNVI